jgi:hypothetical protein
MMEGIEAKMMATGLVIAGFSSNNQQGSTNEQPIGCLQSWHDLCMTDVVDAQIKSTDEVKMLFLSSHFLKCYPTEEAIAGRFNMTEKSVQEWTWHYIKKIQALKVVKVSHCH